MQRTLSAPQSAMLQACLRCFVPALVVARLLSYARREGRAPQQLALDDVCFKVGHLDLQKFRTAVPGRYPCIALHI